MNKFFVLEGLDSSGKSTQIKLLSEYFENKKIRSKYIHFPRTDQKGIYGELISSFLRGEFGNNLDPYLIALLFASDRNDAKFIIEAWLNEDFLVFSDRYFFSNFAFQGAKFENSDKKAKFYEWLWNLEIETNKIPMPILTLYLKVPFLYVKKNLEIVRNNEYRDYLGDSKDIHETDLDLQVKVSKEYENLVSHYKNFITIDCIEDNACIMHPKKIQNKIIENLIKYQII